MVILAGMALLALLPTAASASPVMEIVKDGVPFDLEFSPFLIENHPGIYLRDAVPLFGARFQEGKDVSYLWVDQRELTYVHNSDIYMADGYKRKAIFPSYSNGSTTLISLETVALELGYKVVVDTENDVVYLNSPAYVEMLNRPSVALETQYRQELLLASAAGLEQWGNVQDNQQIMKFLEGTPLISGFYTRLHGTWERTNNIQIASSAIRGTILRPGDVFSFNDVVGQRSSSKGYLPAPIFSGDAVISGYGGGICQVASTIYNTVLLSGMPVLERHQHSQHVVYVPDGYDATVSWGEADFQFQNSFDYPVEVYAKQFDNYVMVAFFRMK